MDRMAESNKALASEIMAWKEQLEGHQEGAKECKLEIKKLEKRLYGRLLNPDQAELQFPYEQSTRQPRA